MLTGDARAAADAVPQELGIDERGGASTDTRFTPAPASSPAAWKAYNVRAAGALPSYTMTTGPVPPACGGTTTTGRGLRLSIFARAPSSAPRAPEWNCVCRPIGTT